MNTTFDPHPSPISVIIADDHALVRQGLRMLLDSDPAVKLLGEATNGVEAVSLAIELVPDLALIDWKMPRLDGVEAAKQIKRYVSTTKTLVMSGAVVDSCLLDALNDGVDGFVHKDIDIVTLVQAIRTVHSGQRYLSPDATTALLDQNRRFQTPRSSSEAQLSDRELEVLRLMATASTYSDMADQMVLSETTVRTYVRRIFAKLDQPNRTLAVIEGIRRNLISIDTE